jgi:triosephosphate isomerase
MHMTEVHRVPLIAGNWKMNKTLNEAIALVDALRPQTAEIASVEVVVCPPFTALDSTGDALADSNIALGAQNCFHAKTGAFTGEVSPQMLLDVGCTWVIIGHSERRQLFGETDALLNKKVHFAVDSGLNVMFCIGETLDERNGGTMNDVLERQVTEGLKGLTPEQFTHVAIAYEPVWAIGTGVVATPQQAQDAHAFVRGVVANSFGEPVAAAVRIQYGGSAKPDNAGELIALPDVDGFLVGGAALDADSFAAIVRAAAQS